MLFQVIQLLAGVLLLMGGGDRLIAGAVSLAARWRVSPLIIGMTIVNVGTSLPEVVMVSVALFKGQRDAAVGSVLGSNSANILLVLGTVALLKPLTLPSRLRRWELPWLLGVSLLLGLILSQHRLDRWDGLLLCGTALGFILGTLLQRSSEADPGSLSAEPSTPGSGYWALFAILLGGIALPVGAQWVINSATEMAQYFGWSELAIGLTIMTLGSSLPELTTSVAGVLKKQGDLVLGNLIGSNLVNSLVVMAIPALLNPGSIDPRVFTRDYWVMLGATLLLFTFGCQRHIGLQRVMGAMMLSIFGGYYLFLFYE